MTSGGPSALQIRRELEWRACAKDPVHFLHSYWNIEQIGKGYEVTGLRDYQRTDIQRMDAAARGDEKDRGVILKARQIGWTTEALGYAFWSAFFHPNRPWLNAQQSEDEAKKSLFTKVKTPYLMLPAWLRDRGPTLLTDNTEEMRFDNGSSITAVHSGSTAARGRASFGVIMDEAAFMDDGESLFAALDPQCYGPMFVFSTANGMGGFFHDTWVEAQLEDSEWFALFHPWHVVPGRDQAWYERMKRRYRTNPWLFYQEFPSTPAEAFAKSGRTAFNVEALEADMDWRAPEARYDIAHLDIYMTEGVDIEAQLERALIPEGEDRDLELWVWEHPYTERGPDGRLLRKPNFVVAADVAEGLDTGDLSAVTVGDANNLEEVASMVAHLPVEDLGALCEWLGYWYYTALVVVERNNQGLVPLQYLTLNQYPRLYRMDSLASRRRGSRTPRYGWHTNKATKPKMVLEFTKALNDRAVVLRDRRFLLEAQTFLSDGAGGYGASNSKAHDDKVISVLIWYQGASDVGSYPVVWVDDAPKAVSFDEVFALMAPQKVGVGSSPLYEPIGGQGRPAEVKQGWLMRPENYRVPTSDG